MLCRAQLAFHVGGLPCTCLAVLDALEDAEVRQYPKYSYVTWPELLRSPCSGKLPLGTTAQSWEGMEPPELLQIPLGSTGKGICRGFLLVQPGQGLCL